MKKSIHVAGGQKRENKNPDAGETTQPIHLSKFEVDAREGVFENKRKFSYIMLNKFSGWFLFFAFEFGLC